MATAEAKPKGGLEDVVATSSRICFLDGDRGVLAYCGHDIHDLARHATFEETCYLLWHGRLPNRAELGDLQSQLAALQDAGSGGSAELRPGDVRRQAGLQDGNRRKRHNGKGDPGAAHVRTLAQGPASGRSS